MTWARASCHRGEHYPSTRLRIIIADGDKGGRVLRVLAGSGVSSPTVPRKTPGAGTSPSSSAMRKTERLVNDIVPRASLEFIIGPGAHVSSVLPRLYLRLQLEVSTLSPKKRPRKRL